MDGARSQVLALQTLEAGEAIASLNVDTSQLKQSSSLLEVFVPV